MPKIVIGNTPFVDLREFLATDEFYDAEHGTIDGPGATIYQVEDDRNFGRTPAVVEYQLSPEYIREGYVYLKEIRAIWESGAAVQTYDFGRYISTGRTGTYTFVRPDQAAGRDIDLRFARELKQRLIPAQDGEVLLGPIEENAYGPGIGMDQYGRPVTAQPWP